jgi:hypothetical protein
MMVGKKQLKPLPAVTSYDTVLERKIEKLTLIITLSLKKNLHVTLKNVLIVQF